MSHVTSTENQLKTFLTNQWAQLKTFLTNQLAYKQDVGNAA